MQKCPPCKPSIPTSARTAQITFQRPTETPDGAGGFDPSWSVVSQAWVAFKMKSGNEQYQRGQLNSVRMADFTMLWADGQDIEATDRIVMDDGSIWNIRSIDDLEWAHTVIKMTAELHVTQ
jgi:SPP1 family predicted phage head-tail adaptor